MRVDHLRRILEEAEDHYEIAVSVEFPDIDWTVLSYDIALEVEENGEDPTLAIRVCQADFDYPDILRRVKDGAAAIPEGVCSQK